MSHPNDLLGWKAQLNLGFKQSSSRTILARRSQSGPLTVQRPFYPEGDVCHLYLLHPPGGVVGGDELYIDVDLREKAKVLITTPGATKFYRSGNVDSLGKLARQVQILRVSNGCSLEWFPQENIFFDNTHTQITTRIELEKDARFMGWEVNCYGRPASKEHFENGNVRSRLELFRDGSPLILDSLAVGTDTGQNSALISPTSLNAHSSFGTFISTHADKALLEKARLAVHNSNSPDRIGITLIDDILIARCLGEYAEEVTTELKLIWSVLRHDVLGRSTCHPRIWST